LAAILLFASSAWAQFTTVTGTVVDPNGLAYANGTITPSLVTTASPTLNGLAYTPPTQPVGLNLAGSFTMRLADNTVLLPGGTTWNFLVCSAAGTVQPAGGKGPVCFTVSGLTISGTSQNISSQLNAGAGLLSGGCIAANGNVSCPTLTLTPVATIQDTSGNTLQFSGANGISIGDFTGADFNIFDIGNAGTLCMVNGTACSFLSQGAILSTAGVVVINSQLQTIVKASNGVFILNLTENAPDSIFSAQPSISGVTTGVAPGLGVPVTVAAVTFSGKTTALPTTTAFTTGSATASYRISANVFCDTTVSTATATLTVTYTASSNTAIVSTGSGALCTTLGAASQQIISLPNVRVKNGTNITWAIAIANSPNYDASIVVEQLTTN